MAEAGSVLGDVKGMHQTGGAPLVPGFWNAKVPSVSLGICGPWVPGACPAETLVSEPRLFCGTQSRSW